MKILIIENDPTELKLAQDVLTAAGFDVCAVDTAEGAFSAIRAALPEVILLDLQLSGTDGLAIARTLKSAAATRQIPIAAVTSYEDRFTRADACRSGCDAYIVKPLSARRLPFQIAALIANDVNPMRVYQDSL